MSGNPNCGTCAGLGKTWKAEPHPVKRGWTISWFPCPDCVLVPELAKLKAERTR